MLVAVLPGDRPLNPTRPRRPSRATRLRATALALLLACAGCGGPRADLVVGAAASLADLLPGVGLPPGPDGAPRRVEFVFASSGKLARLIGEGADIDVFLAADRASFELAAARLDPTTSRVVLGNRMVMVGRDGLVDPPRDPAALGAAAFTVAIGGPAVPAGRHARALLERRGLLEPLAGRLVEADDVRAVLALVESGAADLGFVYASDAQVARRAQLLWAEPDGEGPPIEYLAGVLASSASPWADAWLDALAAPAFLEAARAQGFLPPPPGP